METNNDASKLDPQVEAGLHRLQQAANDDFIPNSDAAAAGGAGLDSLETGELCSVVVDLLFTVIAGRRGAHWALSPDESGKLGAATGKVVDKYVPNMSAGPEAALLLAVVVIAVPRLMMDRAANDPAAILGGTDGGKSEHLAQ